MRLKLINREKSSMQQEDSDDIIEQQAKLAEAKFKKKKAPLLGRGVISISPSGIKAKIRFSWLLQEESWRRRRRSQGWLMSDPLIWFMFLLIKLIFSLHKLGLWIQHKVLYRPHFIRRHSRLPFACFFFLILRYWIELRWVWETRVEFFG